GTLNVTTSSATIKQIEVELECVDTLINDISGFAYSARFEYENDNCYSVSIPVGTDNNLTGNYSGSLPTTFYPGEKHFTIYFDGNPLTWTLKSYSGTIKKTSTATASKYSKTCHCSSSRLAQLQAELELTEENISKLKLYPNPASSNIHLTTEGLFESSTKITVYDLLGKIYPLKTSSLNASQQLELDVTSLKQGVYFIKVENLDESSVIRFVKQ
ncbi:MAG TPA: T9SS type A sorting domain-containing protein, partial [Bacteroidia bacterium]|nr:T9SS type A sorting domain-containing protein [Bacteroidia bacterium]